MHILRPKGTNDILPSEINKRQYIENMFRSYSVLFNFKEIRTPAFEKTELFSRSIGELTDIVSKEMYSFNNNEFTLKPEMTAPVIRAYLENKLCNISPVQKLFYISNMFRHERPQAGRFREFSQFGAEIIGTSEPIADIELIVFCNFFLKKLGLSNIVIKMNNIGNLNERQEYIKILKQYFLRNREYLSHDSIKRLDKNPIRILDSKEKQDKEIIDNSPKIFDYLQESSINHLNSVMKGLDGLGIEYIIDYKLVRGLDYYTSTTFEIISEDLGAQNAVLGGGRYDTLVEQLGGKPTSAIGFACGIERLLMIMIKNNFKFPVENRIDLYLISNNIAARSKCLEIALKLREHGVICELDLAGRSIKSQMKEANRINSAYIIVIDETELESSYVKIKNMDSGNELEYNINDILNFNFKSHENKAG